MTIEFKEGRHYSQMWFCGGSDECDVMGALHRDLPDGEWILQYRIRHYDGDQKKDPFSDGDTKQWYKVRFPEPDEARVLAAASSVFRTIAEHMEMTLHVIPLHTDDPKAIGEKLDREPWCHRKVLPHATT